MERKIVEYIMIEGDWRSNRNHPTSIERLVMDKLSDGFVLYGNSFYGDDWIYQAMVKYEVVSILGSAQ